jgi:hypothetical protein
VVAEPEAVLQVVADILVAEAVAVAVAEGNKKAFYNIYFCCNLKQYTNEYLYNNIQLDFWSSFYLCSGGF